MVLSHPDMNWKPVERTGKLYSDHPRSGTEHLGSLRLLKKTLLFVTMVTDVRRVNMAFQLLTTGIAAGILGKSL